VRSASGDDGRKLFQCGAQRARIQGPRCNEPVRQSTSTSTCMYVRDEAERTKHYFQTDTQRHTAAEKTKFYDVFLQQLLLRLSPIFFFIYDPFHHFSQKMFPCLSVYYFPVFLSSNSKVGQKISSNGL
jgi:hypothetical protein